MLEGSIQSLGDVLFNIERTTTMPANLTNSQAETVNKLKSELPHKNYKLLGFVAENIVNSRDVLALREYGHGDVKYYESYVIGPRGKVNAKTVLPHVGQ